MLLYMPIKGNQQNIYDKIKGKIYFKMKNSNFLSNYSLLTAKLLELVQEVYKFSCSIVIILSFILYFLNSLKKFKKV